MTLVATHPETGCMSPELTELGRPAAHVRVVCRPDEHPVHGCVLPGGGSVNVRIGLAGLPAAIVSSGMSLLTTDPAPITHRSPICTPGQITTLPPIQQSAPMETGRVFSSPVRRRLASRGCVAV